MPIRRIASGEEVQFAFLASGVGSTDAAAVRRAHLRAALTDGVSVAAGSVAADGLPIAVPMTDGWWSCRHGRQYDSEIRHF